MGLFAASSILSGFNVVAALTGATLAHQPLPKRAFSGLNVATSLQ